MDKSNLSKECKQLIVLPKDDPISKTDKCMMS